MTHIQAIKDFIVAHTADLSAHMWDMTHSYVLLHDSLTYTT